MNVTETVFYVKLQVSSGNWRQPEVRLSSVCGQEMGLSSVCEQEMTFFMT